jgi:hypothetical protein
MSFTVDGTSGLTFPNSTTQASAGGMTLLGTLTTTSGTSQTLSGLTLTNYKFLQISINNVGASSSYNLQLGGQNMYYLSSIASTNSLWGIITIDLNNSVFNAGLADIATSSGTVSNGGGLQAGKGFYTTSSTSLVFSVTAGSFTSGSIRVYGVT